MEASRAVRPPRARASLRLTPLRIKRQAADPAFEQLYKRHAREIYQYALALTANPADAEDVTQTTFMNAYRAFQQGERPRKPHNWLITIAHNVCRMRWRQAGCRPKEVALEEAPEPAALEHEPPALDEVLTALARLSFNQRAALVMRELEGRSYQEIGEVLGVSVSAVEALLFRARRRLKLQRTALAAITAAPLPGSLSSFLGAGGGAVAAGGAALSAEVVLKAAAIVAAGAVTAGAGYQSVGAVSGSPPASYAAPQPKAAAPGATPRLATHAKQRRALAVRPAKTRAPKLHNAIPRTTVARPAFVASQAAVPAPAPAASAPPAPITSTAAATLPLPAVPPPPAVTVPQAPPVVPLPPLPPLPVTVPNPIPPPPPLK